MDVRISYGIDINEVPKMIHKLLNNAGDDVSKLQDSVHVVLQLMELDDQNMEMVDQLLDQTRLKLSAVDRAVSDSQMILKGYINTKNQREEAPTVAPATGESNVD